jgi:hypothetical protein
MVIEAVCQLSANKYLKQRQTIASQKLFVSKNIPRVNGIDKAWPIMQTQAIVIGDFPEYLSQMIPPIIEDMNPSMLKLIALAEANSFYI